MDEIEIEFKNILTKFEYNQLLKEYFDETKDTPIIQVNEYFDTKYNDLSKRKIALRIRTVNGTKELTMKIPSTKQHENIEINEQVQFDTINHFNQLNDIMKQHLMKYDIHDLSFNSLGKIKTIRFEKQLNDELLVLDHTVFPTFDDYELEYEVQNHTCGRKNFNSILQKYNIPERHSKPKIKRFIDSLQKQNN